MGADIFSDWYPVQIQGSAAKPARRKVVKTGPRDGRKIVTMVEDVPQLAVDAAKAGLTIMLPMVRVAYLNVHHKPAHTSRPLLPGFAFAYAPDDFQAVERCAGIASVLRNNGVPVRMTRADMAALDRAVSRSIIEFHSTWANMTVKQGRLSRAELQREFKKGKRVRIHDGRAPGWATIEDVATRNSVKVIHEKLCATIVVPIDAIEIVDYLAA